MSEKGRLRILVGTRKGGYVVEGDVSRKKWKVLPPVGLGRDVFHMAADPRHPGDLYAAVNSGFWGPMVMRSRNWGKKWTEVATPLTPVSKERKPNFDSDNPAQPPPMPITNLWHIEPGHASEPDTIFIGVDPHALFRSDNLGKSWAPVPAINDHETKPRWAPGFGGPCLHTILVHPDDAATMYVGMSAAGTFKTTDGGATWHPVNRGVETPFLPDKFPEVGQCVHHVAADPADPETFYRQDHGGMYVTHDGMEHWTRIGKPLGDDFGFGVATARSLPGRAFFVPLQGESRTTPNGGFQVHEWNDRTRKWRTLMSPRLFPGDFGMHREGIACDALDPAGIYVGTTTGQLFVSPDAGKSWSQVPYAFPTIHSVAVAGPG